MPVMWGARLWLQVEEALRILCDAIHHRGQLAAYLRPVGGEVRALYGPSAGGPAAS